MELLCDVLRVVLVVLRANEQEAAAWARLEPVTHAEAVEALL